ncbi:hypothetical protein AB0M20_31525 [Actinoplanes sp. NPDC051633]|uniref:hypothetical protein n=1 Tax=Actinoplanes sp. NPDC051633 TaxID=3155670 RepID=UPI0034367CA5
MVPALAAALLSGCSLLPGSSPTPGGSGADAATGGDGPSWVVSERGKPTPSPTPTSGGTPKPGASFGFLPLSAGGTGTAATPSPTCSPNTFNFSRIGGLDVTPGSTSAELSWYNVGGYNLVEFKLYAISQDLVVGAQRDVGYATVKPRTPCGQMNATIPNLSPKTHYVFSVDAVVTRKSGDGTHAATVARSHSIRTK